MKARASEIQDLYLEQASVDELAPETLARIESHPTFSKERFDEAVTDLRRQNDEFHRRFDRKNTLDNIRSRAFAGDDSKQKVSAFAVDIKSETAEASGGTVKTARFPRWGMAIAAALPFFLIMGIIVRMGFIGTPAATGELEPGIRTKGLEPRIFIYRDLGSGQVELLENNDAVFENDRLQISYLATGQNYGCILSIDGASVITLHYPENSNMLPRLQPRDEVYLPYGYQLDDAPAYERFLFVTSEEAFDVREMMASIAPQLLGSQWVDRGILEFPEGFQIHRLDLVKPGDNR